jgi:tetratricopeptide (TPR) repeat protein
LLEEGWTTLTHKYRFEPVAPILIEVFDDKNDFAVRSLGLPDIGPLVGICFGRVITLISPDTLAANWQEVVWHEFAHVITLQMTRNRMPRWLSEGISVYEGDVGRPEWGRGQELDLVKAVQLGKLLPIAELNDGFAKADSVDDLQFAYFQSYLVVQFIVEEYGFEYLRSLVEEYAEIKPIEEMFEGVFHQELAMFESAFRAWIDAKASAVKAYVHLADPIDQGEAHGHGMPRNPSVMLAEIYTRSAIIERMQERIAAQPKDFQAHLQLGVILFQDEEYDEAREHLQIAKQLVPEYGGFPSPQQVLFELYEVLGDEEAMLAELKSLAGFQQHDFKSLMKLARIAREEGDDIGSEYYLQRAIAVDPYNVEVHRMLAGLAKRKLDYPSAVREYEILLELDVTDPVGAYTDLAEMLFRNGNVAEARQNILTALEIAPTYERAQSILLDIVEG